MKTKKIVFALIGFSLFLTWGIQPLEAGTPIKKLGTAPFFKAKALKADQVLPILTRLKKDVRLGFSQAGADALYEPFMKQLQAQKPETVSIQPGQTLQWMIYKKKGKVRITKDRIWAGKAPFEAYRVVVRHNDHDYDFILPKICLNISLKEVVKVPALTMAPKPSEAPKTVAPSAPTVSQAPPVKEPETKTPAAAAPSAVTPVPAREPEKPKAEAKKGSFVVDIGLMARIDPSSFGLARLGYRYNFTDQLALTGLVGAALLFDGEDDHPAFLADLLFTYYPVTKFFLGAGVGLWSSSQDSKADLILEIGLPLTNSHRGPNFELFLEGRSAFDQMGDYDKYGRAALGLRILF